MDLLDCYLNLRKYLKFSLSLTVDLSLWILLILGHIYFNFSREHIYTIFILDYTYSLDFIGF